MDSKKLKVQTIDQNDILDFTLGWEEFYDALGLEKTKGLLLTGDTGLGKTTLMNKLVKSRPKIAYGHPDYDLFVQEPPLRGFSAPEIADYCARNGTGWFSELGYYDMFIDDIGSESSSVSKYGNVIFPISDLIEFRYRKRENVGLHFFTSNLSTDKLLEVYGERAFWRIIEMCHCFHVQGTNLREVNK